MFKISSQLMLKNGVKKSCEAANFSLKKVKIVRKVRKNAKIAHRFYLRPMKWTEIKIYQILTVAAAIFLAVLAVFSKGTGDDGDSVHHFLYAKYAFLHPNNFFDHWAKPLFVMIAAPFAQFGFVGIKLLNAALLTFQIWLLGRVAMHFEMKNAWLLPIFSLAAPMNLTHTMSGLTEPLFAVWMLAPMVLLLRGRENWAYFLWSFLPFVRSEGLIILCPIIIYMIWRGHFRWIPMLAAGHILMGLAGWSVHGTPFWPFTKIPYASLEPVYGSGRWIHYGVEMPQIIGDVLTFLLVIGLLDGLFRLILSKKWLNNIRDRDESWLFYGLFLAFFIAHTIFWAKGIFKSFGLLRVFLGIMPCIVLICLNGANRLINFKFLNEKMPKIRPILLVILVSAVIFNGWKMFSWKYGFGPTTPQLAMANAAKILRADFGDDLKNVTIFTQYVEVPNALNLDFFDRKKMREGFRFFTGEPIPPKSVVVFDNWFMGVEAQIPIDKFEKDNRLILRGVYDCGEEKWDKERKITLFYVDSGKLAPENYLCKNPLDTFKIGQGGFETAGRRGFQVDKTHAYSPGFNGGMASFETGENLVISFDAHAPDTAKLTNATLVFQCEDAAGKIYDWRSHDLKTELKNAGMSWKNFRFLEILPKKHSPSDKLLIYIWNDHELPVLLDNFEIRLNN
jgi:hypothetical protein